MKKSVYQLGLEMARRLGFNPNEVESMVWNPSCVIVRLYVVNEDGVKQADSLGLPKFTQAVRTHYEETTE